MFTLKNYNALITGGSKGIGKATVELFLELGANVIFTARNKTEIETVEAELRSKYKNVQGIAADGTNSEDIEKVKTQIDSFWGKLDVLVNNAGNNIRKPTLEFTEDEYQTVLDTNVKAPFNISRSLHPLLLKSSSPSIINVASVAGLLDVKTGSPYGISKAGLLQLTRNLAVEWADDGIRVNSVSPWFTETPLTENLLQNETKKNNVISRTPLNRVAKPEEIADRIFSHEGFILYYRTEYNCRWRNDGECFVIMKIGTDILRTFKYSCHILATVFECTKLTCK